MSRSARLHLPIWDGEYDFQLRIGELQRLQEASDAGPLHIQMRLRNGTWKIEDVRETLRLGLIGAGRSQDEALTLIRRHVDPPFLAENVMASILVLSQALTGAEDESLGEPDAGETKQNSLAENFVSPGFMGLEPSSA